MAIKTAKKKLARMRRKRSIRKRVSGDASRPRLTVFRSAKHIYVQVIDDRNGETLAAVSSLSKEVKPAAEGKSKVELAQLVGETIAKVCLEKDIKQVSFDRNGYVYHGRIAAVATGAREAGLDF